MYRPIGKTRIKLAAMLTEKLGFAKEIKMVTWNDFHEATRAAFRKLDLTKKPHRRPDFISPSGSQYWKTRSGVYRFSDHWRSAVKTCDWYLIDSTGNECDELALGWCSFSHFRRDQRRESIYAVEFTDGTFRSMASIFEHQLWKDIDHLQRGYLSEQAATRVRQQMKKQGIARAIEVITCQEKYWSLEELKAA